MRDLILKTLISVLNTVLTILNQLIETRDFDSEEDFIRTYAFQQDTYKYWDFLNSINIKKR